MITLDQAKQLRPGDILLDSRGKRWKVNGHIKLWKTRPDEIRVPLKHGLYAYDQLTHHEFINGECHLLTREER